MVCQSSDQPFESMMCCQLKESQNDVDSGNFSLQYKSTGHSLFEINSVYYIKDSIT